MLCEDAIDPAAMAGELVARMHEQHAAQIEAFAFSMLRSREDAEDATQLTFLNAFNSLRSGGQPAHELSWLYCIARNVCLNRIRTRKRKQADTLDGVDVASSRGLEDALDQRLHAMALRHALDRLPSQQRTAIVMRELQGATHSEIASALDTTSGAVESLLFRARRHLARSLQPLHAPVAVAA